MRDTRTRLVVLATILLAAGCTTSAVPEHTKTTDNPRFDEPSTGSLLPARHRVGGLPLDIYDAEALRNQGVNSAAGALNQIPQNTGP
ncbi:hypothetical protein V5738_08910 [Salinisphaera sp. SPP-AMP-43]|uniref:hypothetical protein n=1 Tax=Salinisphaera sp. SPP-AMP-43 TaxID=3121288 RepID=UPI003C6E179D